MALQLYHNYSAIADHTATMYILYIDGTACTQEYPHQQMQVSAILY